MHGVVVVLVVGGRAGGGRGANGAGVCAAGGERGGPVRGVIEASVNLILSYLTR